MLGHPSKWIKLGVSLLLFSLFLSCTFEFSEDFFVEIEQTEPNALFTVFEVEDNMVITQPITARYAFNGNGRHRLYSVNISIDNQGILGTSAESGEFEINPDDLSEGEHQLTLRYQYSSGTRSLADLNDLERLEESLNFTFTVDKSVPQPVNLTGVEVIDGTIFINWEAPENNIVQEACLNIHRPGEFNPFTIIPIDPETINNLIYNDTQSTELELEYSISLKNRYGESESERISLSLEKPAMYGEIIDANSYRFIWGEHPLYSNFDNYSYNVRPNNTFVDLSNRGGEYIVNDPPTFAQPTFHSLNLQRNGTGQGLSFISERIHFGKSFDVPWGINYVYNQSRNSIYTVILDGSNTFNAPRDVVIYELNAENLQIINSRTLFTIFDAYADLTVDPISQDIVLGLFDSAYIVDPGSLQIKESFSATDYVPASNFIYTRLRNRFLVIERTNGDNVAIYNTTNDQLLYQESVNYRFFIADDGSALFNQNTIYLFDGNTYQPTKNIGTIGNVSAHAVHFIPEKNLCIYSNVNSNPVIYNYLTDTSISIPELTGISRIRYDFVNEKLTMFQEDFDIDVDKAFLVNLNGQVEKSLECFQNNRGQAYYPLNRRLITNQGFYLDNYYN